MATQGKVNKMQAVREIIAKYGPSIKPLAIQGILQDEYKVKVSADMCSTYKTTAVRQLGKPKGKPGRKPKSQDHPAKSDADAPALSVNGNGHAPKASAGTFSLQDLAEVKGLIGRLGARTVLQLAEVLA